VVYTPNQSISLFLTQDPNGNPFPQSYLLYLENLQTGEKLYHPNYTTEVTDMFGLKPNTTVPSPAFPVYAVPKIDDFVWFGNGGYLGVARPAPSTPGSYRYVMELRNDIGTEVTSRAYAPFTVVTGIQTLSGDITSDLTLTNDRAYLLQGIVIIKPGATLTIEAGTVLFGDTATLGGLSTEPGGRLVAIGTARRPIVFTSSAEVGQRQPGDWFGVSLAGNAPINVEGGTAQVEGIESITYGGSDPEDDSGILRYVRIEYAGVKFTPEKEANGLYLSGVGSGTVLEYLHFNNNADDNIEFYGGTVNVRFVFCTGGNDDQLDWTEGFAGKVQFVIVQVYQNSGANRGIEADNLSANNDAIPRSAPKIYNMTIVGPQQDYDEGEGKADHGLMLRRGTAPQLFNFIVIGYGRDGLNLKDSATFAQANAGNLIFDYSFLFNNGVFGANGVGNFGNTETETWARANAKRLLEIDPMLRDPYHRLTPDYMPKMGSPATGVQNFIQPPDDGFFMPVSCAGGVCPDYNWLAGGWVYISVN
jgi:hypothetical protein